MSAQLKDELNFSSPSPDPKLVGERSPDSVLFNIRELDDDAEALPPTEPEPEPEPEPEKADDEVIAIASTPLAPSPPPSVLEEATKNANSSGLIDVRSLLDEEDEPVAPLDHGLVPTPAPTAADSSAEVVVAPPSKMPMVMMLAAGIAAAVALFAVVSAMQ